MLKNTLSQSTSPYLLQHKDNPVHWQEWSDDVLALAKEENKCLLISVGYSACHWCHVMAHESFEDKQVAEIMNEHFINIKIDREERPDIDQIYMDAAQILTGRGGWPLNAFALPDGRPFYAGTYFPKGNWIKVLKNIAQAYSEQPETIINTAERLTEGITNMDMFEPEDNPQEISVEELITSYNSWFKHLDFEQGGIDKAPKFPMPCIWQSLLEYYAASKNEQALNAVEITLDKMYHGGIYDWIGGGFSRYSVDNVWFAPHFEKMLYDNAQLIGLYADAYKIIKKDDYLKCIENTLTFMNMYLKHEQLGYYSALDADSEGEEGFYYTWTLNELKQLLSTQELEIATDYFNLKSSGNWENQRNILAPTKRIDELSQKFVLSAEQTKARLDKIKSKLQTARDHRVVPGLDNKLITAHNAMMVKGLIKAYQASGQNKYKTWAIELIQSLIKNVVNKDFSLNRLLDKATPKGFLDDYAFMTEALLFCYETSFDIKFLQYADYLIQYCLEHFSETENLLFYYTSKESKLIARKIEFSDNVIPSSNAVMAGNLWKLGHLLSKNDYTKRAKTMVQNVQPLYEKYSLYFSSWHQLQLTMLKGQIEVAVTGPNFLEYTKELQKHYWPYTLFCGGVNENIPQLHQKVKTKTDQIFICQNQTCSRPQTNVKEAAEMLKHQVK